MDKKARCFLDKFVEEFPAFLEEGSPLPFSPLSHSVSLEELHGESLELGMRMLTAKGSPLELSTMLCQVALSQLLQNDLSPFHRDQEEKANQEDGEKITLLNSEAIQCLFLNKLIGVALEWSKNLPVFRPSPTKFHCFSVHAIKNTRRKMEDRHLALADFNQLFGIEDGVERSYYAVFDGHGGVEAATYAATHLHVALSKQKTLQSDTALACKVAMKQTDDMFRIKARRERLRSGTTAVVVLIQGQELTVAWLGDSQAMLVQDGQPVTLMNPHKPNREDEKQRIEDLGGCVTFMGCWRVNGTYAVSRAIGDFDQKPYVSGDADCSTVQLCGNEDYVLLACDGFFDVIKPSEVPHLVLDALQEPSDKEGEGNHAQDQMEDTVGESVARKLVGYAKEAGSGDNITVMIVFLRPLEHLFGQKSKDEGVQPTDLSKNLI